VSEQYQPICVERILVSLDSSKHSFSALKAAVELAHHYEAKLKGVFIHDSVLLSLAETQFLNEVGQYTAISRKISLDRITHGMIVQSRWVARTFYKIINQTGLNGEFLVLHGNVLEVIDQESEKCDLLVIGKTGTHPLGRPRLGSTTKALIQKAEKSILLVEEDTQLGYPMFVIFEDSPLGWISLETADDLLGSGENLNILIEEDSEEEIKSIKDEIRAWAVEKEINISFQPYKVETFERFLQKISRLRTGLFVIPFMHKILDKSLIEKCLTAIRLPILMIHLPE